jgi:hypothetical protein
MLDPIVDYRVYNVIKGGEYSWNIDWKQSKPLIAAL